MYKKLKEMPYKVYRAKLPNNNQDANDNNNINNNHLEPTTNRSMQTGSTTHRATLTASKKQTSKPAPAEHTNELPTSQQKSAIIEPLSASTAENPTYALCKSENLTARESARATARTLQRHRSQSSEDTKRQPVQPKARKKRSQSAVVMNAAQKTALEKEAIKKRLEELRQNTRKIICKNVQNKQKMKEKKPPEQQAIVEQIDPPVILGNMSFKRPSPRVKKTAEEAATTESATPPPAQPAKRMGILRKPEYKDHSYSELKDMDCNKENFLTHAISPDRSFRQLPTTLSPSPAPSKNVMVQVNGGSVKSSARLESELTSAGRLAQSGQKPNWPQAENTLEAGADLPYWLRPTSVQIYPYNFIKAVRRKLEAVTSSKHSNLERTHVATSTSALQNMQLNQSTMCDLKQKSVSLKSLSIKPQPPVRSQSYSSSKQLQSLESNFSSISIQLPASNTVSEVSSLASEVHDSHVEPLQKPTSARTDDDTTVSSSILSNVEMEVKSVSPLDVAKIDNLKIESRKEKNLEKPIDLDKFLQDFNRSLSKVIEVNAQLRSTLDKSHTISNSKKTLLNKQQQQQQHEVISTEYENELFTKISSSSKLETTIAESISKNSSTSSEKRRLSVLSPNTINNSYERNKQNGVDKNETESRKLQETNINMKRGDFQRTLSFETEEILTEVAENVDKVSPNTKDSVDLTLNLSEETTNFYNTSVYQKLLQKGVSQEDCLRACLKIREKFILERSKSQIALLEIQKERYKSKGLLEQLVGIKKKQRAIILKMEREREEIQRLLQAKSSNSSISTHSTSHKRQRETSRTVEVLPERIESSSKLQNSTSLEKLLQKREADLQRRRDYVERLLQRHRRLDQEEIELQQLEQKLLKYNHETLREKQQRQQELENLANKLTVEENSDNLHNKSSSSRSSKKNCLGYRTQKMELHLKEIDRSMRELRSISDVRSSSDNMNMSGESSVLNMETNVVRTTGCKLNKLWRRLTSQQVEKYEPNRRYKLCKADVERLYEEAKFVVLNKFAQNKTLLANELLDKSLTGSIKLSEQKENGVESAAVNGVDTVEEDLEESAAESAAQGNYHPSVAEENFNLHALSCTSISSHSDEEPPYSSTERKKIVEENVEKFLLMTNQLLVQHATQEVPEAVVEEIHTENSSANAEISTDLQENNQSPKSTNDIVTESQLTAATEAASSTDIVEEEQSNQHTTVTPESSVEVEQTAHSTEEVGNVAANVLEEEVYSADFETSVEETRIEDISAPIYETTFETTRDEAESTERRNSSEVISEEPASNESTRVIPIENKSTNIVPCLTFPNTATTSTSVNANANSNTAENGTQLMPDIINELEIRRCQQIILENDQLKQYEHVTAMPYVFVREIPNKPPPPYVPPAHGSPMTTIFPSEERIKDITYRRTHELYCQMLKTDYVNEVGEPLPSVLDDKITNIYERIILDICCEYLKDNREVLEQGDPANFHSQLAFFNPPDRLRCLQESIHREVRRSLAMDKTAIKRSQVYSVYGQRAKRDHIDKIIIQELYDDDEKWCNFQHEEQEVLELMVEEMLNKYLQQVVTEVYLEECPAAVVEEETKPEDSSIATETIAETSTTAQD